MWKERPRGKGQKAVADRGHWGRKAVPGASEVTRPEPEIEQHRDVREGLTAGRGCLKLKKENRKITKHRQEGCSQ